MSAKIVSIMKSSASTSRTLGVGQIFPLIFYFLVTVVGWVAPVVRCHVSHVPIYTLKKVNLRFPRELTKELIRRPNAGTTPTVTSYPLKTFGLYVNKVCF